MRKVRSGLLLIYFGQRSLWRTFSGIIPYELYEYTQNSVHSSFDAINHITNTSTRV